LILLDVAEKLLILTDNGLVAIEEFIDFGLQCRGT
jgi:hypothetical protein